MSANGAVVCCGGAKCNCKHDPGEISELCSCTGACAMGGAGAGTSGSVGAGVAADGQGFAVPR